MDLCVFFLGLYKQKNPVLYENSWYDNVELKFQFGAWIIAPTNSVETKYKHFGVNGVVTSSEIRVYAKCTDQIQTQ